MSYPQKLLNPNTWFLSTSSKVQFATLNIANTELQSVESFNCPVILIDFNIPRNILGVITQRKFKTLKQQFG